MDLGLFYFKYFWAFIQSLILPLLQAATWKKKNTTLSGLILSFKRLAGVKERH